MGRLLVFRATLQGLLCLSFLVVAGSANLQAKTDPNSPRIAVAAPSHPGDGGVHPFQPKRPEIARKGTAVLNVDTAETFASIQAAIDDPDTDAGDILEVFAAQHDEGQVVISKSVTLRGATGTEVVRMAVDTGSSGDARAWFLVNPGVDLHVRDLTFDGNGFLIYQAFRHRGTGSFENCHFIDIQFNASGPDYQGTAIVFFGSGNVDVRDCLFEQIGRLAVFAFGSGVVGAVIEDNTFLGKGDGDFLDYPIEVGGGAVVTVRNNAASDCRGVASVDGSTSAGILVSTALGAGTAVTAIQNTWVDNAFGLLVGPAGDTSVVNAEFNRIVGNGDGLRSDSPNVTAENNWWGCNAGPNTADCDSVVGIVDFNPWLVLGLSAVPSTIAVNTTSQLTADLTENSDAADTFGMGNVPDGINVAFEGSLGSVSPTDVGTTDGSAEADFLAGLVTGTGSASATVDNQTVSVDIEIEPFGQPTLFFEPIGARSGSPVDVPVEFNSGGEDIAAIIFSLDFDEVCLSFDPTDSDMDGIPDSITYELAGEPDPPSFSVTYDAADTDGELDFAIADFLPPLSAIPDGTLVTVTFDVLCAPAPQDTLIIPMPFSDDPQASFGNTSGQSVPGTSVDGSITIFATALADCNNDGVRDAGDLPACVLEVFDGDGNFWLDAPGGTFPGNPAGCDANEDTIIDAGDLSCKVLIILQGEDDCMGSFAYLPARSEAPSLRIPTIPTVGSTVTLPVFYEAAGHEINGLTFAIEFDSAQLGFDPSDANDDGIPDAITLNVDPQTLTLRASGDPAGVIDLGLLNLLGTIEVPETEAIATITFEILGDSPPAAITVRFAGDPRASFGSREGQSISGQTDDGTVLTGGLFLDGFETGDPSRWSVAVF